jgi:hypothetical protein
METAAGQDSPEAKQQRGTTRRMFDATTGHPAVTKLTMRFGTWIRRTMRLPAKACAT